MNRAFRIGIIALLFAAGCGAAGGTLVNAAVNTAIGAGTSAARRSEGRCYTACDEFTRCNPDTGYCVPIPCRGKCHAQERCVKDGPAERCIPVVESAAPATAPPMTPAVPPPPPKPPWLP